MRGASKCSGVLYLSNFYLSFSSLIGLYITLLIALAKLLLIGSPEFLIVDKVTSNILIHSSSPLERTSSLSEQQCTALSILTSTSNPP